MSRRRKRKLTKGEARKRRAKTGADLLRRSSTSIEMIDGEMFIVKLISEKKPPNRRSQRTRYHFADVEKEGDR